MTEYDPELYPLLKRAREALCRSQVMLDESDQSLIQGALDRIALIEVDAGRGDHSEDLRATIGGPVLTVDYDTCSHSWGPGCDTYTGGHTCVRHVDHGARHRCACGVTRRRDPA